MAGTMVHFYVMREYLISKGAKIDGDYISQSEYAKYTKSTQGYVKEKENDVYSSAFLGATGPDIFYMATVFSKMGGNYGHYSDFMHYKNAGLFIKNLYSLKSEYSSNEHKRHIDYLCKGFISHVATDLVYHPFVNSLVGKYEEHLVKSVDITGIPGFVDGNFPAHLMVEMAQDYYVMNSLWKGTGLDKGHNMILTHRIKDHLVFLAQVINKAIGKTYKETEDIGFSRSVNVQNYLSYFLADAGGSTLEEYPDWILDNKFNYKSAIQHQKGGENVEIFLKKSVELTDKMIQAMEAEEWEKLLRPWNLDTGLYTEPKVEDNEIKISFKKYENIW
jgi:hypothetical protein